MNGLYQMRWLTNTRIAAYATVLLVAEMVLLLGFALASYGVFGPTTPFTTDYASFFAAGRLANDGQGAAVYDWARHYAVEQQAVGFGGFPYLYFFYPPVFLLLCAPLAHLPYLPGFYLWETASFLFYFFAVRRIHPTPALSLALVAFPAALINYAVGQNGLLTAGILALATARIDRKPWLAGALFGLLCYKPHFAVLLPVALLAGRHFRALAAAAASAAVLIVLSVAFFGLETWQAFFAQFGAAQATFETGRVGYEGTVSLFGAVRVLDGSVGLAYVVQVAGGLLAAAAVAIAWARRLPLPSRAMILISGTLLAMPVVLFYDLTALAVVLAWASCLGWQGGWRSWDKLLLVLAYFSPLFSIGASSTLHLPVGALAVVFCFFVSARRLRQINSVPAEDRLMSRKPGEIRAKDLKCW